MKKDWIKKLPPGEYTMQQIKDMYGLIGSPSAKLILLKYGAKLKRVQGPDDNFYRDIFVWKGYKEKKEVKKCS